MTGRITLTTIKRMTLLLRGMIFVGRVATLLLLHLSDGPTREPGADEGRAPQDRAGPSSSEMSESSPRRFAIV